MTAGEIIFFSMTQLLYYEKSPSEKKGSGLGIYRMIYASSRIAGPVAGSFIYQTFGGKILWFLCFLLSISCLFPSFYLFEHD